VSILVDHNDLKGSYAKIEAELEQVREAFEISDDKAQAFEEVCDDLTVSVYRLCLFCCRNILILFSTVEILFPQWKTIL